MVYFFLLAETKAAMYLNIIYGLIGVVGLLIVVIVSFVCYKIFKRYVASSYQQRFDET